MEDIDLYYRSIKQVYDRIRAWEYKPSFGQRVIDWLMGISIVIFILSLFPVLPATFVFIGSRRGLAVGRFDLTTAPIGKFMLSWIIAVLVTGIILGLMIWINNKVDPSAEDKRPPHMLSPDQVTFISVYESYQELRTYFVSHISEHIDNSLQSLKRIVSPELLWRSRVPVSGSEDGDVVSSLERDYLYRESRLVLSRSSVRAGFPTQVSIAESFVHTFENYAWFQLDPALKSIFETLTSLPSKVYYRLLDKEDLPAILSVLENLSNFIYAYLPEHRTNMKPEALQKLQVDGRSALDRLVQEVSNLAPYRPIAEQQDRNEAQLRSPSFKQKISGFYTANVFFRFAIWSALLLAFTGGTVFLLSQRLTQLDVNIMVSTVIGTSVAGAAALAAFAPKATIKQKEQPEVPKARPAKAREH